MTLEHIQAHLLRHPCVTGALITARQSDRGVEQATAYITTDLPRLKAQQQRAADAAAVVGRWSRLYELTYSNTPPGPSFAGWNSSYTRQPIPEAHMHEWLRASVGRVRAMQPQRVLEIGCGTGLLLQQLAPQCVEYVGTDLSAAALARLKEWMRGRPGLQHVGLLHRSATELNDLTSRSFDTVILNSVVQYFPDVDYLLAVLGEAVRLLRPGGKVFLGDVKHRGLLRSYHSTVQMMRADRSLRVGELKRRIESAIDHERELAIDPDFFRAVVERIPGFSAARVELKRVRVPEELTHFRYDVVLHVRGGPRMQVASESVRWEYSPDFAKDIEAGLRERRWPAVCFSSVMNVRLARATLLQRMIDTGDDDLAVDVLADRVNGQRQEGLDPELFWELGEKYDYDVCVGWGENEAPECFQAELIDTARRPQAQRTGLISGQTKPWNAYANDPLEHSVTQQLVQQLQEHVRERFPTAVMPSEWVVVKQLPQKSNE
jgi:SAM-dependent methyltransferase